MECLAALSRLFRCVVPEPPTEKRTPQFEIELWRRSRMQEENRLARRARLERLERLENHAILLEHHHSIQEVRKPHNTRTNEDISWLTSATRPNSNACRNKSRSSPEKYRYVQFNQSKFSQTRH